MWKIALGIAGLLVAGVLALVTIFWWAPVGINNYANKVTLELALTSPESLTQLGLIDGTMLDFHSGKLDDYTDEGQQRMLASLGRAHAGLDGYGAGLKGQERLTFGVLATLLGDQITSLAIRIPAQPYRVNQISGVAIDLPAFLTDMHRVTDRKSAERYVQRLSEFGRVLREVKIRIEEDRVTGITPPDFVIDKTLVGLRAFVEGPVEENLLVASFASRMDRAAGIGTDAKAELLEGAKRAVADEVLPGYRGLIALFEEMRPSAPHDAGVWRLPEGAQFYEARLRIETGTDLPAQKIHDIGLAEVARIEGEMNAILDRRGLPKGEVGQRIDVLMKDPEQLFPNTDAGREEVLTYLRGLKAGFDARAKDWFISLPRAELEIVRVPAFAEDSAAGGYYNPPALDGSRPGRFYINLRNTADYPKWTLPTLFYHEAEPGHHFQLVAAQSLKDVPVIRQVSTPAAFGEGWGLYAEKLVKEMGVYEGDELGDLGRLQGEMFRAVRLVVDTGMHEKRWSREEAIAYMRAKTGMTEDEVTREIERYVVWPGQACTYKIGEMTILRLRAQAELALGDRFDIRAFHETVLMNGGLPLTVLEEVVDSWILETKLASKLAPK